MTKQYCNYKFHQKMKNGIENIKTLILMDLSAVIVIFGICDEITKWQESVVMCVAALLAAFIPGIGYAIVYHKYKRLKNIEHLITKMNSAKKQEDIDFYKDYIPGFFKNNESFDNFDQIFQEYNDAYASKKKAVDDLFSEIKKIKKLKV